MFWLQEGDAATPGVSLGGAISIWVVLRKSFIHNFAAGCLLLCFCGCSLQKETTINRNLQNLTAHYNILFNANELLRQKQEIYEAGYIDAYDRILSVYQDTTSHSNTADKELEAAIAKANDIISTKEQSHYIGDAYLVLGKANHLYGHYFNSVEYFKYVTLSFPKKPDLVQEARVWGARSSLYLSRREEAKVLLDSALKNINPKKRVTSDVYAAALEYHIDAGEYAEAEAMAKLAVKFAYIQSHRLRLTFILAQLQELNKEPQDAYISYSRVVKSNAPFEMAFNADLNRIRLEENASGRRLSRMERLQRLLRDDKNSDFIDQIYYQIALLYLAENNIPKAINYLQLSVHYSNRNQNQKGLSYLRLADISFKDQNDYVAAKKFYDSTLLNLSPNYPDYTLIQRKANNLQVLAENLQIIGHEDTLQTLAKMSEKDRTARIDELVKVNTAKMQAAAKTIAPDPLNNNYNNSRSGQPGSTNLQSTPATGNFYFYNTASVSQGFTDFKRIWGNRKLEDSWRRSRRSGSDITANSGNALQGTDPDAVPRQDQKTTDDITAGAYRQGLLQNLPLSAALMEQSEKRVYNAYTTIANFYRDILDDKPEAVTAYEALLKRYPNDQNKPALYYNLYRLYSSVNQQRSEDYKDRLLKEFPNSLYSRVIRDPDYNRKVNDKDAEFNALYNSIYDLYSGGHYASVVTTADSVLKIYPNHPLSAQLHYLRTIAAGHQEKFAPFREELLDITGKYPNDRLITPLINQHIVYLEANKLKMSSREFALADNDPNEEPFIPAAVQPQIGVPVLSQPAASVANRAAAVRTPPANSALNGNTAPSLTATAVPNRNAGQGAIPQPPPQIAAPPVSTLFNVRDSTNYYFVVNVNTGTTNLASSRFGIGQFNRANYAGNNISHQLKNAGNDNQLIYIGRFYNLAAVKNYARQIIPLMPQIMKVPADKYMFFIITQENLDKLADKKKLDQYIDFYQKAY